MEELWKPIMGYEGRYEISNYGRVKVVQGRDHRPCSYIKKTSITKLGYEVTTLWDGERRYGWRIHQLVAIHFIPNPENKPCIDHIDTNKLNNRVDNLRWVTHHENNQNPLTLQHNSIATKGEKNGMYGKTPVNAKQILCITTGEVFIGRNKAADRYRITNPAGITQCCLGHRKTCGQLPDGTKLEWRYVDESNNSK